MSPLETLLEFVRQHLLQSLVLFAVGVSILRKILQQASQDQARRKAGGAPTPASPDDDLREQVRRGFEEMMRQRSAAAAAKTAPKAPAKAAAKATPKAPPRQAPGAAPRAARPPPPALDPSLARSAALRMVALAKQRQEDNKRFASTPSSARRLLGDRKTVRRAFLLSEILGEPRSLRAGR